MYYVYVLKSLRYKNIKIYIGFTSNLRKRLKEHNDGKNKSTRYGIPWKLVYYEAFYCQEEAKRREEKLKYHGQAKRHLKERIAQSISQTYAELSAGLKAPSRREGR